MQSLKIFSTKALQLVALTNGRAVNKTLHVDALIQAIKADFGKLTDHRAQNAKIALDDAIMSAFAVFHLKDQSLLAFDERRRREPENLHTVYGVIGIPCDSQMRAILDEVDPDYLRPAFRTVFRRLQRGKKLESMTLLGGHYLLSGDGTGFYSSTKVASSYCLKKTRRNGTELYYQQMYAAALVHPDWRELIPFFPEMIFRQDGSAKNDCERNAARRFFEALRREHPHLKLIVTEDALSSNAPHIEDLQRLNLRFILGVKPGDHQFLFSLVDDAIAKEKVTELQQVDSNDPVKIHFFCFINQVPLNQSRQDLLVNFLEYWQVDKNNKVTRFSWVTDLTITPENVEEVMRAGRARWKIENETFNTLKPQGYNLEHNYGLGKKHLSAVFAILMMLAFLVDQVQQMRCHLFQAALKELGSKRALWEMMRNYFRIFRVDSMETIFRVLVYGPGGYIVMERDWLGG
nr:transposase [uncultured Desulfobulbus sp.]